MKLIVENIENMEFLVEKTNEGKKEYFIKGVFLSSNKPNKNRRVYPQELLQREVNRYTKDFINENRAFGELGHPDSPTINLDRVSHIIVELKADKDDFIGKAKILDTPYGKIVKTFLDEGAKLGVSSRGLGTLEGRPEGYNLVKDDFFLATAADIVADPSAHNAFVRGIMESKEWIYESGIWKEIQIEKAKTTIKETVGKESREKLILEMFNHFISKL